MTNEYKAEIPENSVANLSQLGEAEAPTVSPPVISSHKFRLLEGQVGPFGATLLLDGCNFSIYCPDAEKVFLCLFDDAETQEYQIELQQRSQSKWFGIVQGVKEGQKYAYRVKSKPHRTANAQMDEGRLLIDPYAKKLSKALHWNREHYEGVTQEVLGNNVLNNAAFIPKSIVCKARHQHSNGTNLAHDTYLGASIRSSEEVQRRNRVSSNRIIYEAHVKGLTKLHPLVPEEERGTYKGASHPAVIEHLVSLGVTTVQFLPVFAFMPEPYITEKGLTNYWGYNPICFFSAEPRYATVEANALDECREMIAAYKAAGLEVILDVVYNHTAESGEPGSILSFKGFCHQHAYLQITNDELNQPNYLNYSGCGNTVNTANFFMTKLILDSLRYWVIDMGVDGFRFDLAATLGREASGFNSNAEIFKMLRQDPVLKSAVMIAEPWDIGPGGYQLGQFPDYWLEVNDKFRDGVRGFWRSDKGLKADFATRLMGSKDVFPKGVRPMHTSVNNVTYHDGFTLHDMVSYNDKHNLANREDNQDGHNHNLSNNYGVEGATSDEAILALRERQKRNLFASLILSQGTAHVLGGDELSRTQEGNNNAYCQDNSLNWYHWELNERQQAFLDFSRYVIGLRNKHQILHDMMFDDDNFNNQVNVKSSDWYRVDGSHKRDQDWSNDNYHCFALHLETTDDEEWLYCVNSSPEAIEFNLPLLLSNDEWECLLHTAFDKIEEYKDLAISPLFEMPERCFTLFKKR
jgi:glycogen operon protein